MAASRYSALRADVADLLINGLGSFLAESTDGRGMRAHSALLGQQLTKAFEQYYALKLQLETGTIDCAVMAIAKSGKSTFINASAGASILPSNNVPETARVVSIEHTALAPNEKPYLTYKLNDKAIRVEGEGEIYSHLEYCNKEVRSRPHSKEDEQVLSVHIDIAALPEGNPEHPCRLRILDTPGTNEANEDRLRHSVERLLDSVDAVVYILDYTKLKTSEEAKLLSTLKEINPMLIQRLSKRLFFVVNKIDCMHSHVGLQEHELCEYVAQLVTQQMNSPAFQLGPEQVMLVSAHEALLARLVLQGKASKDEQRMFVLKAWGSSWARKRQQKSDEEMQKQAECMLEDSRLPELEHRLFTYLYNNAGSLKLMSLMDNMTRLLNEVQNGASTGLAAMQQTASALQAEAAELEHTMRETMGRFDLVQGQAEQIELEVTENVQARMQALKERIFAHVNEVLGDLEEPALPAVKSGPWRKIWEKAARFLTRSSSEANNDAELKSKLRELNQDIHVQINSEIQQFWRDLEVATNERHRDLVAYLNQHLDSLARVVEQVVGSALNLQLEPITMKLDPPSLEQFHKSIERLFARGIGRNMRVEKQSREETHTHWETRYRGLCRSTEYYVGVPVTRTVEYDHEITTFQLNKEAIKGHFQDMVESSVNASSKYVREYVHTYLSNNINTARKRISDYGQMYSDWMEAALRMKAQSFEQQDAEVQALQGQVKAVATLLGKCVDLQEQAAQLVPEADPDTTIDEMAPPPSAFEVVPGHSVSVEDEGLVDELQDIIMAPTQGLSGKAATSSAQQSGPAAAGDQAMEGLSEASLEEASGGHEESSRDAAVTTKEDPSKVSVAVGQKAEAPQSASPVPFWESQGDRNDRPASPTLPLSSAPEAQQPGHHTSAFPGTPKEGLAEAVPAVLRQDSADSSEWECLSHENYLGESQY